MENVKYAKVITYIALLESFLLIKKKKYSSFRKIKVPKSTKRSSKLTIIFPAEITILSSKLFYLVAELLF